VAIYDPARHDVSVPGYTEGQVGCEVRKHALAMAIQSRLILDFYRGSPDTPPDGGRTRGTFHAG
jgi:hypothetical protein